MADACRQLQLARQAQAGLPADSGERQAIVDTTELLSQLLLDDVKRGGKGAGDGDADADGGVNLRG